MTSEPSQQTIIIHILSNISQSKRSQPIKFSQIIQDNNRNNFLKKVMKKMSQEN